MKEPFALPENDRERLTRTEMHCLQWFVNAVSTFCEAGDDLIPRLEMIPAGRHRMNMLIGAARSILIDMKGTIPEKQWKNIKNTAADMEARLVPKLTPQKVTVTLDKETAMELVDAAQIKCTECIMDNDEARECKLCKMLETVVPLESYKSVLCPYTLAKWEDKP